MQIVAGYNHTCARDRDGAVWCWGSDDSGVLGAGASGDDANRPVPLVW